MNNWTLGGWFDVRRLTSQRHASEPLKMDFRRLSFSLGNLTSVRFVLSENMSFCPSCPSLLWIDPLNSATMRFPPKFTEMAEVRMTEMAEVRTEMAEANRTEPKR